MEIEALEEGRQTSRQESIIKAHRQNQAKIQEQRQQQQKQKTAKAEQRPEQQQGEVGAADLAAVLMKALKLSPKKTKQQATQKQQARQANRNAQYGQLKMKQNESLTKTSNTESSVSRQTRLLSAPKSGTVAALQVLMAPKESKNADKKSDTTTVDAESPELSDEALGILDRNKTREANSAKMRQRTSGPQNQNFLNQNQGATIKRFSNPVRSGQS